MGKCEVRRGEEENRRYKEGEKEIGWGSRDVKPKEKEKGKRRKGEGKGRKVREEEGRKEKRRYRRKE